jgi:hypothetical protein
VYFVTECDGLLLSLFCRQGILDYLITIEVLVVNNPYYYLLMNVASFENTIF